VTIIRITPGLDAGEMLAQEALDILPDETTGELEARLAPLGATLGLDVVRRMKAGPVAGTKQDPSQVTKAPKLTKEMGLIDWSKPAGAIARQVRAMQPWPTAYTFFHRPGKEPMRVIIAKSGTSLAIGMPMSAPDQPPGTLTQVRFPDDSVPLCVVCSPWQRLIIAELQPAGKKRMTAEEFLRGYPIQEGYRFGPESLA
jgi:methionyl-tRNA formyltransferase